jgi:hypothetical protein
MTGFTRNAIILCVACAGTYVGAVALAEPDEPADTNTYSTPTEAACDMLEDGDTAVEAFDILVGLDVSELTASRAVNEAMANGCG